MATRSAARLGDKHQAQGALEPRLLLIGDVGDRSRLGEDDVQMRRCAEGPPSNLIECLNRTPVIRAVKASFSHGTLDRKIAGAVAHALCATVDEGKLVRPPEPFPDRNLLLIGIKS
jgi:hypothetical protein